MIGGRAAGERARLEADDGARAHEEGLQARQAAGNAGPGAAGIGLVAECAQLHAPAAGSGRH